MPTHDFKNNYFKVPTWCDHCDGFIEGVFSQQGKKCKICKFGVHFKCAKIATELECCGSKEKMESIRRKKRSKNLIEDTLKCSSEKLESDEEYAKQIYSIINPALSYTHWQDKTLAPEQQFIKSEKLKNPSPVPSKDQKHLYTFHQTLLELIETEYNYNIKLGKIFHIWIKQLAIVMHKQNLNASSQNQQSEEQNPIPDVFNCMFAGFPTLYCKQIERWRGLMEDIEEYGFGVEALSKRFIPVDSNLFKNEMSSYFFHCKNMKKESYHNQLKQIQSTPAHKAISNQPDTPKLQLNDLLNEPFQRICRYPLLLSAMKTQLAKHIKNNPENDIVNDSDKSAQYQDVVQTTALIELLLNTSKSLTDEINDEMRQEEERTLYAKINYNQDLLLGSNTDRTFSTFDKFNFVLKNNQDRLKVHKQIQINDPTRIKSFGQSEWMPDVHLIVCDTVVVFCRETPSEIDPNTIVWSIMTHPHPFDLSEFSSLEAGEGFISGNFNIDTDIMYRSFVKYEVPSSPGSEDFKSGRVTTGVKGIRFASVEEKDNFLNEIYPKMMNARSSGSGATGSRTTTYGRRGGKRMTRRATGSRSNENSEIIEPIANFTQSMSTLGTGDRLSTLGTGDRLGPN